MKCESNELALLSIKQELEKLPSYQKLGCLIWDEMKIKKISLGTRVYWNGEGLSTLAVKSKVASQIDIPDHVLVMIFRLFAEVGFTP